jgi:hypothetical protein
LSVAGQDGRRTGKFSDDEVLAGRRDLDSGDLRCHPRAG